MGADTTTGQRTVAWLNYASLLAIMAVMAAVLTAASVLQYAAGELPCPLCLLQRVAMLLIYGRTPRVRS